MILGVCVASVALWVQLHLMLTRWLHVIGRQQNGPGADIAVLSAGMAALHTVATGIAMLVPCILQRQSWRELGTCTWKVRCDLGWQRQLQQGLGCWLHRNYNVLLL